MPSKTGLSLTDRKLEQLQDHVETLRSDLIELRQGLVEPSLLESSKVEGTLPEKILELLKEQSQKEHTYINPNFLQIMNSALYDYYDLEDEDVDQWINDMWGA